MKNITHIVPVVLTGGLAVSCTGGEKPAQRPNIIHIMTDDHSYQTISAYGGPLAGIAPTPNIDRLADEGMLFTHSYVDNSISAPSRATLLTGKYSHIHGQRTLDKGFVDGQTVFPELLQEAGYQTAIVGKWHLNIEPYGFDYYKILYDQGDYYNPEFKTKDSGGEYVREEGYATTLTTDHALEWLDNRDPDKPFCLLLHHKAPHRNWMPEPQYLDLYKDIEIPYPETLFDDYEGRGAAAHSQRMMIDADMAMVYDLKVEQLADQDRRWINEWNRAIERMTPEQREAWLAAYTPENEEFMTQNLTGEELVKWKYQRYLKDYLRCIKSVDDQVGRVLDYLDQNGLAENTIVVYTSDQGFYMGEHGWFDKRFMYEESFRMPLLVRYPAMMKTVKNRNHDALVQNIDFAPTYLSLAGAQIPEDINGVSMVPLFGGETPKDWRDMVYYHYYDYPAVHLVRRHEGVRTDKYKLIHFYGDSVPQYRAPAIDYWEFYDMEQDPHEMRSQFDNPEYAEIIDGMRSRMEAIREDIGIDEPSITK